jgi:small GTP-binding protein
MIQKKICMLGAFAVGKTSLVQRYVNSIFSDKYLTTVGVKIDKKSVTCDEATVNMILWDIQGEDELQAFRISYLRGMAGFILVVDGTRSSTLDTAQRLCKLAVETAGDIPFLLAVNKSDLADEWELDSEQLSGLESEGWQVIKTSAKTGEGVEKAFYWLAQQLSRT